MIIDTEIRLLLQIKWYFDSTVIIINIYHKIWNSFDMFLINLKRTNHFIHANYCSCLVFCMPYK